MNSHSWSDITLSFSDAFEGAMPTLVVGMPRNFSAWDMPT